MSNLYSKKSGDKDDERIWGEAKNFSAKDLENLKKEMLRAAADLDFEKAAKLRDEVKKVENLKLV
jgi:excinuclease UvrABC helicase subunit UvrB